MDKKYNMVKMNKQKHIALIAHDNMKDDILEWARENREKLSRHFLCGTGTTAALYDIPVATNRATADFLLSSKYMEEEYNRRILDFSKSMDSRKSKFLDK